MRITTRIGLGSLAVSLVFLAIGAFAMYTVIRASVIEEVDESLLYRRDELLRRIAADTGELGRIADGEEASADEIVRTIPVPGTMADTTPLFTSVELPERHEHGDMVSYRRLTTEFAYGTGVRRLEITRSMFEWQEVMNALFLWTAIALTALVLGLFVTNRALVRSALRPFYDTLRRLRNVRDTSALHAEFPSTGTAEIDELHAALNEMNGRLAVSIEEQREFLQNASHELMTPIAVLRSKVERLLHGAERLPEATASEIDEIHHALVRMSRITNALLLISRIEGRREFEPEDVNVAETVRAVVEELDPLAEGRDVKVRVGTMSPHVVAANRDLLAVLFRNVIHNAIKYSPAGEMVEIDQRRGEGAIDYVVTNRGEAIGRENVERAFKRFTKGRGTWTDSPGLGLAIVRSICGLYRIGCDLVSEPGTPTTMTLTFTSSNEASSSKPVGGSPE